MLVERDQDLAALDLLLQDALAGRGELVFLGGEAGVGKSALVAAVCAQASEIAAAAGHALRIRRGSADDLTTAAAL